MSGDGGGCGAIGGEEFGVGFEENSEDECGEDFSGGILRVVVVLRSAGTEVADVARGGPIFGEERDPSGGTLQRELSSGFRYRRRAGGLQKREKLWEVLQEQGQVEMRSEMGGRCWR